MIERVQEVNIPYDEAALLSKDPVIVAGYILKLVKTLQELLEQLQTVTNFNVDMSDGDAIYSKLKQADGTYPLNTWRLIQVDNDWQRQVQLVVGTWTFAGSFQQPVTA